MGPHYDAENDVSNMIEDEYTSSSDELEEEKKGSYKIKNIIRKNRFIFMMRAKTPGVKTAEAKIPDAKTPMSSKTPFHN